MPLKSTTISALELVMNVDGVDYQIGEIPEIELPIDFGEHFTIKEDGKAEIEVMVKMTRWQLMRFKFYIWKAKLKAYYILTFKIKRGK